MTQENKELLLKDLCARLPYGLKVKCENYPLPVTVLYAGNIDEVKFRETGGIKNIYTIKPYLFPLSSMTEEQNDSWRDAWFPDLMTSTDVNYPESEKYLAISHAKSLDWLYKNHIDIYGFIEKGLAIDATGLNIY